MTPSATIQQSNQRRSNPKTEGEKTRNTTHIAIEMVTYNKTMCFVPPPFILKHFFDGIPSNPLESILVVKQASINFNNSHSSVKGFANVDATVQAKRCSLWAFAVFEGYIKESSFDINPDSEELQKHCNERHA
jgi:hypothetical protein